MFCSDSIKACAISNTSVSTPPARTSPCDSDVPELGPHTSRPEHLSCFFDPKLPLPLIAACGQWVITHNVYAPKSRYFTTMRPLRRQHRSSLRNLLSICWLSARRQSAIGGSALRDANGRPARECGTPNSFSAIDSHAGQSSATHPSIHAIDNSAFARVPLQ
jgi:hypothetical protein